MSHSLKLLLLLSSLSVACGGGGSSGGGIAPPSIDLVFTRVKSTAPSPFIVMATIESAGSPLTGQASALSVTSNAGSLGAVSESSPGIYQFTLTPSRSGEHAVTVSLSGSSVTRTALVLASVHSDWGQAAAVEGLVNTPGYEDGVTITKDGEYLFIQYGAYYFSGQFLFELPRASGGCGGDRLSPSRCSHQWLDDVIGPTTAPERPNFFDGRIANGKNLHNADSFTIGIDQAPNFAVSTLFYGLKRQSDGRYAEPFLLSFEDENDGIVNPFGMSFRINNSTSATMVWALNDPSDGPSIDLDSNGSADVESGFDIYTHDITLGQTNVLGRYIATGIVGAPPIRDSFFPARKVSFANVGTEGHHGTQGNPHLHEVGGAIESIWTDDEFDTGNDRGDLSVNVLTAGSFPSGTWQKVILPSPVNLAFPSEEIQPFFSGSELYFTRKRDSAPTSPPEIFVASYSGGNSASDYGTTGNWGSPVKVLGAVSSLTVGSVVAIGEPSIARIDNKDVLFFVYAVVRDIDATTNLPDLDFQAGFIPKE